MKKLFIAIMAVAAAVSCSQELTVDAPKGAAIAFDNLFVENSTRANDLNAEGIKNVGFGVTGYIVNAAGQQGKIFDNKEIAWNGSAYTYSPAQYWTAGNTYTFAALVPYVDAQWEYTPTDATNGQITFDNEAAAANQDLLYSYKSETMPESIVSKPAAVEFTFSHLLSRVKFSFKNGFGDGENITLQIKDVVVTNVHSNGSVDVVDGAVQDWTVGTETFNRAFGNAGDGILAVGAKGTTEHFYLIPADATYNLTFVVDLYQAGVLADTYNRSANVTLTLEKGKSYELAATLNHLNTSDDGELYPIEFQVNEVDEWGAFGEGVATPTEVAKVASVADLKAALNAGQNVVLTADINLDETRAAEPFVVANDVVIDGAGYTITSTAARAFNISGAHNVVFKNFTLNAAGERGFNLIQSEGANVTIENVTATAANYTVNVAGSATNANVTIKNSNLTGLNTVNVRGAGANVAIENTNITTIDNAAEGYTSIVIGYDAPNSVVNVKGGNIEITGSDVNSHGYDVQGENSAINFDGTTGSVTAKGSNYYIDYGINQYTFATLAAALAKAVDGETITLIHDVTETANNVNTKNNITLDLGGHTLTVAGLDVIDNTGKMTVCNGNIVANNTENTRRCIYNHGEMVINGVNFVQTYNQKGAAINNEGKLTIENATVNAVFYSIWTSGKNAETIVNGGTYTTTNDVNIRDNWAYAVIANNGAKLTVNGGSFTGNHGAIAVEGGATATLNAGTFHCTAEYTGNSDWALYTDKDSALTYNKNNCTVTSANPSGAVYGNVTAF